MPLVPHEQSDGSQPAKCQRTSLEYAKCRSKRLSWLFFMHAQSDLVVFPFLGDAAVACTLLNAKSFYFFVCFALCLFCKRTQIYQQHLFGISHVHLYTLCLYFYGKGLFLVLCFGAIRMLSEIEVKSVGNETFYFI